MTKQQFDKITQDIYQNGRVEAAEDGDDSASFDAEFHFEAKARGFSDNEIKEAQERFK
jgi:hypothetical protein